MRDNNIPPLIQGSYLAIEFLADYNIKITATNEGQEWLNENIEEKVAIEIWSLLLEDFVGNSIYEPISNIEARIMFEPPVIAYNVTRNKNGKFIKAEGIWYFEYYATVFEIEKLANGESITFTKLKYAA